MTGLWDRLADECHTRAPEPPAEARGIRCPECGTHCAVCCATPAGYDELPERPERLTDDAIRLMLLHLEPPLDVDGPGGRRARRPQRGQPTDGEYAARRRARRTGQVRRAG